MEQETLFTGSKWNILQALSRGKRSPFELAEESKTSVANISQQLRLLEIAGLIKSERIPNREKGQPRVLYSLAKECSFLIAIASGLVEKQFFDLSLANKLVLKIWFFPEASQRYYLEKGFWQFEEHLDKIDSLLVDLQHYDKINMIVASDNAALKKALTSITVKKGTMSKTITFTIKSREEFIKFIANKSKEQYYVLHDPAQLAIKLT
ncbi:MAG: ArsR family transcriptional regulator [archaeon]